MSCLVGMALSFTIWSVLYLTTGISTKLVWSAQLFFVFMLGMALFWTLEPQAKKNWITKRFFRAYTSAPHKKFLQEFAASGLLPPATVAALLDPVGREQEKKRLEEEEQRLASVIYAVRQGTLSIFEPTLQKLKKAVDDEMAARDKKIAEVTAPQAAALHDVERQRSILKFFKPI